ncbi:MULTISPECIES: AraC family transcriptional regulator [Sphingobacteriaceae]|uniref:AraC-like DNA-binding protein n=1 Tax=Albibacterium bauzanense TaxID=653929 RepID=A0A4R1LXD7_9SPHI|nr:AraC family transcriptional regulator [Albibacterium bauzanense]TCK83154.1 AraC-like DNA-binding protein [Albibacterium bauzanense]
MPELHIKNMVCDRCISVVRQGFNELGIHPEEVGLGVVKLKEALDAKTKLVVSEMLISLGFELLDSDKSRLIERLKNSIIAKIHHTDYVDVKVNWSVLLSEELKQDYNSLSSLFSSVEGITLEQYIIRQKIECVKELLFYDELTLSEISYKVGYSSVQHLSNQFKKITGQTPTQFKSTRNLENSRKSLDSINNSRS